MSHDRFVFGLTLDQIDELNRLCGMITAHGDVIAMVETDVLNDDTLHVLGDAIFNAGLAVREILDQVNAQRLQEQLREAAGDYCRHRSMRALHARLTCRTKTPPPCGHSAFPVVPAKAGGGIH